MDEKESRERKGEQGRKKENREEMEVRDERGGKGEGRGREKEREGYQMYVPGERGQVNLHGDSGGLDPT